MSELCLPLYCAVHVPCHKLMMAASKLTSKIIFNRYDLDISPDRQCLITCATIVGEDGGMLNGGVHSNPLAQPYPPLAPPARPQFFPQYAMPTQQQVSTSPGCFILWTVPIDASALQLLFATLF